jgi:hypothetical protein
VTLLVSFRKNQSSGSNVVGKNSNTDSMAASHMAASHTLFVYDMILIYLITAFGLTPGGSSTAHIYR